MVESASRSGNSGGSLHLQILGPLRIWRDGVELDAVPDHQASLLALLLARVGRPISTSRLIDLMWEEGDAPAGALTVVQKHVGGLRRLLEPELAARATGSYVLRRGAGYLFTAEHGVLDLVAFRDLVAAARTARTEQRDETALHDYVEALGLWNGPAGEGLHHGTTALTTFAALDREFFDAVVAAAELAITLDQPQRVLQALRLAATMAPLDEPVQAGFVATLAAAGRHVEALSTFRAVCARLAAELGSGPGPELRAAHQRVQDQTLDVTPFIPSPQPQVIPAQTVGASLVRTNAGSGSSRVGVGPIEILVGRAEEVEALLRQVESALAGGSGLVLVEGEPGVGKTRLLEEVAAVAGQRGAHVVWGHCLQGDGTPSMWPWVQAIGKIIDDLPAAARERWQAGELGSLVAARGDVLDGPIRPDNDTQFRLFERVATVVGEASAQRPQVLIVDDLQWADYASLQLFAHLVTRLPRGTALVGAFRTFAPMPGADLTRMLAAASRVPGHRRVRLGPLGPDEVAELVRRETGRDPGQAVTHGIHNRTAGNPFFVRELSRLFAETGVLSEDTVAPAGVPTTVRDVVRDRVAGLDDRARSLLQIAALTGRDIDLGLLARVAELDVQTCLDRLEPVEALGLLGPTPGNPFSVRIAHDLVRESVAGSTPRPQAPAMHLRVADALEHTDSGDDSVAERLAHHLLAAGPLADPARTATALIGAGRRAAAKSAVQAAERQFRSAARIARTAGLPELELSALALTAAVGMQSRYGAATRDVLERAEQLARRLGLELVATGFLFSRWLVHATLIELDRSGPVARQLLEYGQASAEPTVRTYGLRAWGLHQWHIGQIGESFRYLTRSNELMPAGREDDPVRHDVELLMDGMLAETTALHGRVDEARAMFDLAEAAADEPYAITVWASLSARTAAIVGDPAWALHAATRGIAADPDFSFVFLGTYQRLARCWALALTGQDPSGAAAEAQRIIAANLLNPTRTCVVTWHGLLSEMHLAAGELDEAAAALDQADYFLDTYGQRYAEGLILLLRASLLRARGESDAVVRVAAERARGLSVGREAHLFAHRAEKLLAGLER